MKKNKLDNYFYTDPLPSLHTVFKLFLPFNEFWFPCGFLEFWFPCGFLECCFPSLLLELVFLVYC